METVANASGLTSESVRRYLGFLVRWDFAESTAFPQFLVRRRSGVVSPILMIQLLRTLIRIEPEPDRTNAESRPLVERVACAHCGSRILNPMGRNEVECAACLKRQWKSIEINRSSLRHIEN